MQALGLADAVLLPCDLRNPEQLSQTCGEAFAVLDGIDVVVWMAGIYQPVTVDDYRPDLVLDITQTNYVALLHVLGDLIAHFRRPATPAGASGTLPIRAPLASPRGLALVSSVAGYRGLPKALAYGPTKAALTHLAEILHLELTPRGVGVWVINPGFVQTPATAINNFRMPALISAETAAHEIVRGLARSAFEIHFPRRFTLAMKTLALLPYRLYFALMQRGMRPAEGTGRGGVVAPPGSPQSGPVSRWGGTAPGGIAPAVPVGRDVVEPVQCSEIVQFFERLTPASLDQLDRIYRPDARFKDPFHEVVGVEAIRNVLAHMFRKLPGGSFVVTGLVTSGSLVAPGRSEAPGRFEVPGRLGAPSPQGMSGHPDLATSPREPVNARVCCLTWDYCVEFAGRPQRIRGSSWLELSDDGRIAVHRDYWDLAEELYEKIPGLAVVMRWLKRKAKNG
jgi:NAD(P)-dependent dehydrogenase (short-subunit alcohol dehydrogenase family)